MSNVFSRVRGKVEEAISPRVVHPSSETSAGRSWASSSGVIRTSELTRERLRQTGILTWTAVRMYK